MQRVSILLFSIFVTGQIKPLSKSEITMGAIRDKKQKF